MDDTLLANISDTQVDEALNDEGEEQIAKLNRAMEQLDSEEQALISLFYYEEKNIEWGRSHPGTDGKQRKSEATPYT